MTQLKGFQKRISIQVNTCLSLTAFTVGVATGNSQPSPLRAAINSRGFSSPQNTIVIESSDFLSMVNSVISKERELSQLSGQAISASVSYLGVDDSLRIEVDSSLNLVRISIPLTGYAVELKESSSASLFELVENLVKTEGGFRFAELRQEINKRSTIGVTDGNPQATTALLANSVFESLRLLARAPAGRSVFSTRFSENTFRSAGFKGGGHNASFNYARPSEDRISYAASGFATKTDLSGADIWGAGLNALGMRNVLKIESNGPVVWQVGGHAGIMARGSQNLAAGGALYDLGFDSSLSLKANSGWAFWLHSSFHHFSGIPVQIDGFQLDSAVNQMMLKNALECRRRFGNKFGLLLSLLDTRYLKSAAISDYRSYQVQFEMNLKQNFLLNLGLKKEDAQRYRNLRAELHFNLML